MKTVHLKRPWLDCITTFMLLQLGSIEACALGASCYLWLNLPCYWRNRYPRHSPTRTIPYAQCEWVFFTDLTTTVYLKHWGGDKMPGIFQTTFSNAFSWLKIYEFRLKSLKFVPKCRINNIPALVHIMAWRRPGDKPLSEPMMVMSPTHICVTRPQWVNSWSQ